jgi:DNA repair protein RecN (Recombination protein N)
MHANRLGELAHQAYDDLQGDEQALLTGLGRLARLVAELEQIDATMADCGRAVSDATVNLKELAGQLRGYMETLEADPGRQSVVEDRLDLIRQLKKKYGGSIEAVLEKGLQVRDELLALETREGRTVELTAKVEEEGRRLRTAAQQLSKKRTEAAKRLAKLVVAELTALKMGEAAFQVVVSSEQAEAALGPTGYDRVEFLLSSNPGEPPRPLGRVASGGELSRIMLALKTVLAEMDQVPVLVFDEIDTGVGGAVAAAMGTRLRKLGAFHQVFCITHLPQVASQAEHHVLVEKGQEGQRTSTSVQLLKGMRREEEIARMLGGLTITKKVRETAAELIAGAKGRS